MAFDVTNEVPSIKVCKKLKELGYPQDSGGWYWNIKDIESPPVFFNRLPNESEYYIKAPTYCELWQWIISIDKGLQSEDPPAESAAKLLIQLVKNGNLCFKTTKLINGTTKRRQQENNIHSNSIRRMRKSLGITLRELARRVGVSAAMICEIERGYKQPSHKLLTKILKVLKR